MNEAELANLFHQLQETEIEDYDLEVYKTLETDDAKLACLKDLSEDLQKAVKAKEETIADLESEVEKLRTVEASLLKVTHRLKIRLVQRQD